MSKIAIVGTIGMSLAEASVVRAIYDLGHDVEIISVDVAKEQLQSGIKPTPSIPFEKFIFTEHFDGMTPRQKRRAQIKRNKRK